MAQSNLLLRTIQSSAGMAMQGAARFIYTWVVGRFIGAEALGDVSALLSMAIYASLLWPAGLGIAASRFIPLEPSLGSTLGVLKKSFWVSSVLLSLGTAAFATVVGIGPLDAALCGVLVFAYSGYVFTRGALTGEGRLSAAAAFDLISGVIAIVALGMVLILEMPALILIPLILDYLFFTWRGWPRGLAGDTTQAVTVRNFTLATSIGMLATGGLLPATMIFVRATEIPVTAGVFGAALSLATPVSMVSQALNQVLVPHYSLRHALGDVGLASAQRRLLLVSTAGFALVFGILIAFAQAILRLIYGEAFAAGALSMQLLLAVVFMMSAMASPSAYLIAIGRQKLYANIWLVAFVAGTIVMFLASPTWGQHGALAGYALGAGGGSIVVIVASFVARPTPVTDPLPQQDP